MMIKWADNSLSAKRDRALAHIPESAEEYLSQQRRDPCSLPVAILAGGKATRLGRLTSKIPKSLLPVAGRKFIFYQLELLAQSGFEDIVLCIGHQGQQIKDAVGTGAAYGVNVRYSEETRPLGTGGAIRNALPLLGDQFLVMYGDSYLACDYKKIAEEFIESGKPGMMTVFKNDNHYDRSNVVIKSGSVLKLSYANEASIKYIDYGLSAFKSSVFEGFNLTPDFDLSMVHRSLIATGALAAREVGERFYEIGSLSGYKETCMHLLKITLGR